MSLNKNKKRKNHNLVSTKPNQNELRINNERLAIRKFLLELNQKIDTFLVIESQKSKLFRNTVATTDIIFFIANMKLL
ncbi:hypothetical protein LEP1GSC038_0617 [Leptospira weilii str. 2006001855]|uniref:Uncharacterized protein n=1 Tax=Leptospira weilii str. 2006001855 TaxID=996804 RepID=M6FEU1_9LEPT|nr:hypothetical protein LEP1GSC038_0617 [Leptospira weilii str. 2006001855]